jgi:hypothetical protein
MDDEVFFSAGIDRHGDCNLLLVESWSNLSLSPVHRRKNRESVSKREIQGLNLNTLLVGVFQLLGSPRLFDRDFPGGVSAWEDLLDSVFVCLLQICTIDEVLLRIIALFERCSVLLQKSASPAVATAITATTTTAVNNKQDGNSSGGNATAEKAVLLQYLQTLCNGSVSFLFYWKAHGDHYFRMEDRLNLLSFVVQLHELVTQSRTKSQAQQAFLSRFTNKNKKDKDLASASSSSAVKELVQSTLLSDKATERLTALVLGMQQRVNLEDEQQSQSLYSRRTALNPQLSMMVGTWTGGQREKDQQEQKERLKACFAAQPEVKLEIFGGAMLLDMSDDDDDTASPLPTSNTDSVINHNNSNRQLKQKLIAAECRISAGMSLLDDKQFCSDRLLAIDIVELARQWTIVDHALFQSISLQSMLSPCFRINDQVNFNNISTSIYSDHKFSDSLCIGGVKRLVDRFNAASLWVSHSVLQKGTPKERAATIATFVKLAVELQKLGNYHALMSILTALQQGAISRLQLSFDLVPKSEIQSFNKLKV